jgi:multiple sugar transport system substrate-binding protein
VELAKALQGKESPKAALGNAVKACNTLLKQQG